MNPEFPIERRYASILTTVFVVFTYGVAMPVLFVVASFIFIFQSISDKLLITYFYKERVEHNDVLNRNAVRIIKYALVIFLFVGGLAMAYNYCTLENVSPPINFTNETLVCYKMWTMPITLVFASALLLSFFITFDLMSRNSAEEKF